MRGKKATAKPEAVKAEKSASGTPKSGANPAATQAVQAEKSPTPRSSNSTSTGDRATAPVSDDRGGDERRHGDSRGGYGGPDGGHDGAADSRFKFVVTVLQCDGLQKAGNMGQAGVFVSLSAGSASGQTAAVPCDGGRPQWNRSRGYVPAVDTASDFPRDVADTAALNHVL